MGLLVPGCYRATTRFSARRLKALKSDNLIFNLSYNKIPNLSQSSKKLLFTEVYLIVYRGISHCLFYFIFFVSYFFFPAVREGV